LTTHNFLAADRAVQNTFVQYYAKHRRFRALEDRLSCHPSYDSLLCLRIGYVRLSANNCSRIVLNLQKTRNDKRLPSVQRVRCRFDVEPVSEPSRARPPSELLPQKDELPVRFQGIVAALGESTARIALTSFSEADQALAELGDFR